MTAQHCRIEAFGSLKVLVSYQPVPVTRFRTQRAALLLAFLSLRPSQARARVELCEMLWPEEDPTVQRARLRYELSTLRAALGPTIFSADQGNESIRLSPWVTSDVSELDAALQSAVRARTAEQRIPLLRKIVALYKDPLLPGLYLPDNCPPEYDWISLERDRFHESCFDALSRLITDLETLGLYDEARLFRSVAATRFADRELSMPLTLPSFHLNPVSSFFVSSSPDNRIVGRDKEMESLRAWALCSLPDAASSNGTDGTNSPTAARPLYSPLLTVTGPGGIGKTRLAVEATSGHLPSVFVSLADVDRGDRLFTAIHAALRLPQRSAMMRGQVEDALRVRGAFVLVLDNLEHIVQEASALVQELLRTCPELKILATSRRPLNLPKETLLVLTPLSTENALELFLKRAQNVRPDFARTPPALQSAREAVSLLEGIPLALELAAARAAVLGPVQIRRQLSQRLSFLVSVRPGRDARHESMTATLAWSVGLLSDAEKHVLASLSVFRSGATLEAVYEVCGLIDADSTLENASVSSQVLNALENLQLHSLLTITFDEEQPRYGLLIVVREFAERKIVSDAILRKMRLRHFDHYAALSRSVQHAFREGKWAKARDAVTRELENIRAAVSFCASAGPEEAERAFHLMEGIAASLFEMGFWEDVKSLLDVAAPAVSGNSKRMIKHLGLLGALARRHGDEPSARQAWERQLSIARESGDADPLVDVLFDLGGQALDMGEWARARTLVEEGVERADQNGLTTRLIAGKVLMARLQIAEGFPENAKHWADSSLALLRALPENASQSLYVIIHLVPVYRTLKQEEQVGLLLQEGFGLALVGRQPFLLARVADEMGPAFESCGCWRASLLSYYLARETHAELGSRLRDVSANAFDDFLTRFTGEHAGRENAPRLLTEIAGLTWQSVADLLRGEVARGFVPKPTANDLQMVTA